MKSIRIFVSSPGDVGAEREKAREIFDRLQVEFSGVLHIAPYFWEHEPLRAHTDPQTQTEPLANFDLCVCLLWSRLGTRLYPGLHQKPDGGDYASGTEYELYHALDAFRRSGAPEVLVYKRQDDPVVPLKPKEERERMIGQYDALQDFFEQLTQKDGHIVVGINSYAGLENFETKFEGDMRKVLSRFVPEGVAGSRTVPKSWMEGSPFRGLRYFDFEHAPIFFGRTRAIDEALAALKQQAADERAFVLVFGGSGVGKSSLVRAGVLPWLVKPGVIDGVGLWRRAVMRPSEVNEGDLFDALAAALMRNEGLQELASDGTSAAKLAAMLREKPDGVGMLIKGALSQAAREVQLAEKLDQQPRALFALAIDQLEELFTVERLADQREGFLRAVDALARSGYVWVLATLRSDFYPRCEESPLLMELKKGAGQFHLQPPDEVQLGQMIRLPASAAGLLFEEDHKTGERLDDLLRDAAVKSPAALPLLEFALEELYEQRDNEKGLLKLHTYRALGGVEGALGKRAEESFQGASKNGQESFDLIFRQLVTISTAEDEPAVRRRARKAEVETSAGARELVAHLTANRLLVADRTEDGEIVIGLAHEAILASWPRLALWVESNRESLKVRAQVAADANRWIENDRSADYLYSTGLPLEKARVAQRSGFLTREEIEFVEVSGRHAAAEASRRVKVLRRWLTAVGAFAIIALATGAFAWQKKRDADTQKAVAQGAREKAVAAKNAADELIRYMQYDLRDTLGKLGQLKMMEGINGRIRRYHDEHPAEEGDAAALREKSVSLNQQGDVLKAQGHLGDALKAYRDSLAIFEQLAKQYPDRVRWQDDLSVTYGRVGDVLRTQGDLGAALQSYRESLRIHENFARQNPGNADGQHDLSVSYNDVGDVLRAQRDLPGALQSYRDSLAIRENLAKQNPGNTHWESDLCVSYENVGDVLMAQRDFGAALQSYRRSLAIREKLAGQDPTNAHWQRALSVCHDSVGDALRSRGDIGAALQSYRDSRVIIERLAEQDPANTEWQRDLSLSYSKLGDVLRAQDDLGAALQSYRDSLAICEKLAKQDSSNAQWQGDLSRAYDDVGDALRAQDDLGATLQSYRDSLAVREKLVKQNPANAQWQDDLSVSYSKVGDALRARGDFGAALQSYRDALAIREKLVEQDPTNTEWQHGLSHSYEAVGDVLSAQGDLAAALQNYRRGIAIFHELAKQEPGKAHWQHDVAESYRKVGDALSAHGDLGAALQSYRDSVAIREKLAKQDPDDARWQWVLSFSLGCVAKTILAMPNPNTTEAERFITQGLDVLAALENKTPPSAEHKQMRYLLEQLRESAKVRRSAGR